MPTRKTITNLHPRRDQLSHRSYRDADKLEQILSNPGTPDDVKDALIESLISLSNETQVGVQTPRLVRAAFLEMCFARRVALESNDKREEEITRAHSDLALLLSHVASYNKHTDQWQGFSCGLARNEYRKELVTSNARSRAERENSLEVRSATVEVNGETLKATDYFGEAGAREFVQLWKEGVPHDEIIARLNRYTEDAITPVDGFSYDDIDDDEEEPEIPSTIPPHVAPVIDFMCWKQSRPRPIKNCTVDVTGGAL